MSKSFSMKNPEILAIQARRISESGSGKANRVSSQKSGRDFFPASDIHKGGHDPGLWIVAPMFFRACVMPATDGQSAAFCRGQDSRARALRVSLRKGPYTCPEAKGRHKVSEKPGACATAQIKEGEAGGCCLCKARERYHGKRHSLAYGLEVAKAKPKEQPRKKQHRSAVRLGKKKECHGIRQKMGTGSTFSPHLSKMRPARGLLAMWLCHRPENRGWQGLTDPFLQPRRETRLPLTKRPTRQPMIITPTARPVTLKLVCQVSRT